MRFQKNKLHFDGVTRHVGSNIRRYVYDGGRSICVSRDYEPDTQTDLLTVSIAMPKGMVPDSEWVFGLLKNFGMRTDISVSSFENKLPCRTTFYYQQNLPRRDGSIRDCGGIKPLPLLS